MATDYDELQQLERELAEIDKQVEAEAKAAREAAKTRRRGEEASRYLRIVQEREKTQKALRNEVNTFKAQAKAKARSKRSVQGELVQLRRVIGEMRGNAEAVIRLRTQAENVKAGRPADAKPPVRSDAIVSRPPTLNGLTHEQLEYLGRQESSKGPRRRGGFGGRPNFGGGGAPGGPGITREQVAQIQRDLKAQGFDPGKVDGIWGPKTQRAWDASAARAGGAAPAGAAPAGPAPDDDVPTGPARSAVPRGLEGLSDDERAGLAALHNAGMTRDEIDDLGLRQSLGANSFILDVPELRSLVEQAKRERWPREKMQARLEQTQWWRTTAPSARAFLEQKDRDPAGLARVINVRQEALLTALRAG
jgi:hypothetical protein